MDRPSLVLVSRRRECEKHTMEKYMEVAMRRINRAIPGALGARLQ